MKTHEHSYKKATLRFCQAKKEPVAIKPFLALNTSVLKT